MPSLPGFDDWLDNHGDPDPGYNWDDHMISVHEQNMDHYAQCEHEYISWHGLRGECQDCGEIVVMSVPRIAETDVCYPYPARIGLVHGE